jgi:hypothetical protein
VTDGSTEGGEANDNDNDEESFSDSSSSSSLEKLPSSPLYDELAPTVLSDYEDGLEDLHTAPAHMAVDDVGNGGTASAEASASTAREAALEEQLKEQRAKIDQLGSKLDQFIELMMSGNRGTPPQGVPPEVVDPQEEELQDGILARGSLNHERQHQGPTAQA